MLSRPLLHPATLYKSAVSIGPTKENKVVPTTPCVMNEDFCPTAAGADGATIAGQRSCTSLISRAFPGLA